MSFGPPCHQCGSVEDWLPGKDGEQCGCGWPHTAAAPEPGINYVVRAAAALAPVVAAINRVEETAESLSAGPYSISKESLLPPAQLLPYQIPMWHLFSTVPDGHQIKFVVGRLGSWIYATKDNAITHRWNGEEWIPETP